MSSTSGARFHIPFPTNFLSLNTPIKKSAPADATPVDADVVTAHGFLSNRSVTARHSSISSVSSISSNDSTRSPPSSPPAKTADSPMLAAKAPAFLPLNSKYQPSPINPRERTGDKHTFLSNRQ